MKTRKLFIALIIGLTLGLLIGVAVHAEGTADMNSATIDLTKGKEIPKEIVEKLNADQLYELMQIKMDKSADVPMLVPVIVGIVFACPVAIVAVILWYRHRRNAMLHKTLAAMIDKGVPIPPELLHPEQPRRSDLRRGVILIALGLGIVVFFLGQKDNAWGLGFIPLLIGVGYLITWKMEQRNPNR